MSRMSAKEFREQQAKQPKRRNKFNAKRTELDGIVFDSQRESQYYALLKRREKLGEVSGVELQQPYALTIDGQLICTYRADFSFDDLVERRHRVVDTKGVITPEFRIKQKLMKAIHNIDVEVVK